VRANDHTVAAGDAARRNDARSSRNAPRPMDVDIPNLAKVLADLALAAAEGTRLVTGRRLCRRWTVWQCAGAVVQPAASVVFAAARRRRSPISALVVQQLPLAGHQGRRLPSAQAQQENAIVAAAEGDRARASDPLGGAALTRKRYSNFMRRGCMPRSSGVHSSRQRLGRPRHPKKKIN
jgi:hypothetical protein